MTVQNIRQTKYGELLLTVPKGGGGAEQLKDAIGKLPIEGIHTRHTGKVGLHVRGIDGATSEAEVENALRETVNGGNDDLQVKALRPTRNGNQVATDLASRKLADELTSKSRFKLEIVMCTVQERVSVEKCRKW